MKSNLNKISLVVLGIILTLLVNSIFKPGKPINQYEKELKKLKLDNQRLFNINDSLTSVNRKLDEKITKLLLVIDSNIVKLNVNKTTINKLQNEKNKKSDRITKFGANDVSRELSNYIDSKTK